MPAVTIIKIELVALVPAVAPREPSTRFDQHREGYFTGRLRPHAHQRHQRISVKHYLSEVAVHSGSRTIRPGFRQRLIEIETGIEPDALRNQVSTWGISICFFHLLRTFARPEREGGYFVWKLARAC